MDLFFFLLQKVCTGVMKYLDTRFVGSIEND